MTPERLTSREASAAGWRVITDPTGPMRATNPAGVLFSRCAPSHAAVIITSAAGPMFLRPAKTETRRRRRRARQLDFFKGAS